jgi:hypothetical protein
MQHLFHLPISFDLKTLDLQQKNIAKSTITNRKNAPTTIIMIYQVFNSEEGVIQVLGLDVRSQ